MKTNSLRITTIGIAAALLTGGLMAARPSAIEADSLYTSAVSAAAPKTAPASLFVDAKASKVGDILTVVISEEASGTSAASTKSSKSDNINIGPGFGTLVRLIRNIGVTSSVNSQAAGQTQRTDNLRATIAVTVTEVLPNGNMKVRGSRQVGVNAETMTVTLTGMVRPVDIGPENTVPSPLVSDAQIKYSGHGPVGEVQHDSLLRRLFRFFF